MSISIVIPTFNRVNLLERTLESVLVQTSSDWECIVVDDFSTDNTKEVVYKFIDKGYNISYYINRNKKGAQGARNTGLDHAKNEWVIFFDSDNILHPNFIELMTANVRKHIDVLACCSDIVNVKTGRTGQVMNPRCHGDIHDHLFKSKSYVDFNQSIIRRNKLLEIGGLDEDCPSMQEWDTHIRLSKVANYDMVNVSLVDYYQGGGDAISSNPKREVIGRLYILQKHIREWRSYPWGLTIFCYQIYSLIEKINDLDFVKDQKAVLFSLVPLARARIYIVRFLLNIRNIIR